MFLSINDKNVFHSDGGVTEITPLSSVLYINLNQLIQIEFNDCLIKQIFLDRKLIYMGEIKFFGLSEDGVWNFKSLYFVEQSMDEFKRVKNIVEKREKGN